MATTLQLKSVEDTALNLLGALYGIAPSNTQFQNARSLVGSDGDSAAAARLAGLFAGLSNQQFTAQLLANLGISSSTIPKASYDTLVDALHVLFAAYPPESRGQISLNASRLLSGLTDDVTYGAAARAWNSFKQSALDYAAGAAGQRPLSASELASQARFSLSSDAPAVVEGRTDGATLTFTLTLDKPAFGSAVVVRYATLESSGLSGSATANIDYLATQGSVTIPIGSQSATVSVAVRGDTLVEGHEAVRVAFSGELLKAVVTGVGQITNDDQPPAFSGRIIDGYVRGATVFVDYNGNGLVDSDLERATQTTTDATGGYTLSAPQAGGTLVATGGVNIDTGNPNTLVLKAPAVVGENNAAVRNLTPLTTLITEVIERTAAGQEVNTAVIAQAESLVRTAFNLGASASGSLLTFDPVAVSTSATASAEEKTAALAVFKAGVQVATLSAAAQGAGTTAQSKATLADKLIDALVERVIANATPSAGQTSPSALNLSSAAEITALLTKVVDTPSQASALATSAAEANTKISSSSTLASVAATQDQFEDRVSAGISSATGSSTSSSTTGSSASSGSTAGSSTDPTSGSGGGSSAGSTSSPTTGGTTGSTTPANRAPVTLAATSISVAENTAAVGTFTTTDPDAGDTLTYSLAGTNADKFLINTTTGALSFKAAPNFEADPQSYTITVVAADKAGLTASQPLTVTVTNVNEAPVTSGETLTATSNTAVTYTAAQLLGNDADPEGRTLSIRSVNTGSGGTATLNPDGTVSFSPTTGFTGTGSFTYVATDGELNSATTTVTVNVQSAAATNQAPTAAADTFNGTEDVVLTLAASELLGNDSDPEGGSLRIKSVAAGTGGTVVLNTNGSVTFTPTANFNGAASFSYTITDGQADSSAATVSVSLAAVNDAPTATADSLTTPQDTAASYTALQLLGNDRDVDGDNLTIRSVTAGTGGTVSLTNTGAVAFTPNSGFSGNATFTYVATDGQLDSLASTVTVAVTDTRAPTATVTLATGSESLTRDEVGSAVIKFSEPVLGFDVADLTAPNLLSSSLQLTASTTDPTSYTLTFKAQDNITNAVNALALGDGYTDAAGNRGSTATSGNYSVDSAVPTVTITLSDNELTVGETATVTVSFSEAVTGFDASDLVPASNAKFAVSALSQPIAGANGAVSYTATLTPNANTTSANTVVTLAAGSYNDGAGNAGAAASSASFSINTAIPTAVDSTTTSPTVPFSVSGTSGSNLLQIAGYDGTSADAITLVLTVNSVVGTVNASFTYRGSTVTLSNVGGKALVTPAGKFNLQTTGTSGDDRLNLVVSDSTTEVNLSGDLGTGNDTVNLFFADVRGVGVAGTNAVKFASTMAMAGSGDSLYIYSRDPLDTAQFSNGSAAVDFEVQGKGDTTMVSPTAPMGVTLTGAPSVAFPA